MKGYVIDGNFLLPVSMYMERMRIPYARLKRPRPKDIVMVDTGEDYEKRDTIQIKVR